MNAKERDMQDTRTLGHERQIRTRHLCKRVSIDGDSEDVHEHAYAGDHVDELWGVSESDEGKRRNIP